MPTDKEKFIALMIEFGLTPKEEIEDGQFNRVEGTTNYTFETPQPKVVGYASSVAVFSFNPDDSFKEVGVWEQ